VNEIVDWVALQLYRRLGLRSEFIQTDHGRCHVFQGTGSGELGTVVLVHGLSARAAHYRGMVEPLLAQVDRLILPELLGHGRSVLPDHGLNGQRVVRSFVQTLDQVLTGPAVIFGNSLGGYMALRYAHLRPERVQGLFLSSPAGAPMDADRIVSFTDRFNVLDRERAMRLVELGFAKPRFKGLLTWAARQQFGTPAVMQLIDTLGPRDMLSVSMVAGLNMPVTFAWGTEERVLLPEHRAFFCKHLPDHSTILEPEGWGHSPITEVPESVAAELIAFLHRVHDQAEWSTLDGPLPLPGDT
jgi:pimeloyl-ACP methyl ester carboxylesterase